MQFDCVVQRLGPVDVGCKNPVCSGLLECSLRSLDSRAGCPYVVRLGFSKIWEGAMSVSADFLPEFDSEMASARRTLERIPEDKLGWKAA